MTELHTSNPVETRLFLFILALIGIGVSVYLVILLLKKIPQPYSKWTAMFLVTLLCSIFIVFLTLGLPKTINDPNKLHNMMCGWPIPFIMFNSGSALPDYAWTKSCIGWAGSPMDTEKEILWIPFLTNVAIAFSGISGIFYLLHLLSKGKKREGTKTKDVDNDKQN